MQDFDDFLGPPAPLDVEAFLGGDRQGRDSVRYGADAAPVRRYLGSWSMPDEDYRKRREALDDRRYGYFGSCPECEAEGAIFPTPDKTDVLVCSAGCETAWVFGWGHFRTYPEDHGLTDEEARRKLSGHREVEPLLGWKLDILSDLDVGVRTLEDVRECSVCGFSAVPEDLRKLSRFVFFSGAWPLLSLNRQAPLCMVCGDEFSPQLQDVVNGMWWLGRPTGLGKTVSAPYANDP